VKVSSRVTIFALWLLAVTSYRHVPQITDKTSHLDSHECVLPL
jgi:hypothetical protein